METGNGNEFLVEKTFTNTGFYVNNFLPEIVLQSSIPYQVVVSGDHHLVVGVNEVRFN